MYFAKSYYYFVWKIYSKFHFRKKEPVILNFGVYHYCVYNYISTIGKIIPSVVRFLFAEMEFVE